MSTAASESPHATELRRLIAGGHAVLVLGSGVSAATVGPRHVAASWSDLILDGIATAVASNEDLQGAWEDLALGDLQYGLSGSADATTHLTTAAEKVLAALGGSSSGAFRKWISDAFREMPPRHDATLARAIEGLGCPVLTTNYDTFYERSVRKTPLSVTWRDPAAVQDVLARRTSDVVHLHGLWSEPTSIVLSARDYGRILENSLAQRLQEAFAVGSSLIFVGCGAGLDDPNLGALFDRLTNMAGSTVTHYNLRLRDDGVASSTSQALIDVIYGDAYSDLPLYISSLVSAQDDGSNQTAVEIRRAEALAAAALQAAHERAKGKITAQVQDSAVLTEHVASPDPSVAEVLIPPIILPVTPEEFSRANRENSPEEGKPVRADLRSDTGLVVLSGDEKSGLTSALLWWLDTTNTDDKSTPIFVDFKEFSPSIATPLERQLRKQAYQLGLIAHIVESALPPLRIAVDNVGPKPTKVFNRFMDELRTIPAASVMLGVRRGDEAAVTEAARAVGHECLTRYVGRMNESDVRKLALLISPTGANTLTKRAVDLLHRERLARTPLTIALLLSAMLHGESLKAGSSETVLLEMYVNLLLGRGTIDDDARISVDSGGRAHILAHLAEIYLVRDVGALPVNDTVNSLQGILKAIGWPDDPTIVLSDLARRGVLRVRENRVTFAQSSYLHLFLAKRLVKSPSLRATVLDSPFRYGAVIKHHAALARDDADVVRHVGGLLGATKSPGLHEGPFADERVALVADAASLDEFVERLAINAHAERDDEIGADEEPAVDMLDSLSERDLTPFPAEIPEDESAIRRAVVVLSLVSNVLRDSDLVEDLDMKTELLRRTLEHWGNLTRLMNGNDLFKQAVEHAAEHAADDLGLDESHRAEFVENMVLSSSVMLTYAGMLVTLASTRLSGNVLAVAEVQSTRETRETAVMTAMLAIIIREEGWASTLTILDSHLASTAVERVVAPLALNAYLLDDHTSEDERMLVDFIFAQKTRGVNYKSVQARADSRQRFERGLNNSRLSARGRKAASTGEEEL